MELKMTPSLPLLSCESSVSVKENPDRKKKNQLTLNDSHQLTFNDSYPLTLNKTMKNDNI